MNITPFDIAMRFVGVKEVDGNMSNPMILAMLQLDNAWPKDDETPWCSAFVNYIAWLMRLPRSKSLAARSWLSVGVPIDIRTARPDSDIVILDRPPDPTSGHVGFFSGITTTKVLLLAGNQGNSVSVAEFDATRVIGVRRLA